MSGEYLLFVNDDRTLLVRIWHEKDGTPAVEVATRDQEGDIWGPPVYLHEEKT